MMTQKQVRKTKEGISFGLKVLLGILFISPLIIGFLFSIQYEDELTSSPLRLFTCLLYTSRRCRQSPSG